MTKNVVFVVATKAQVFPAGTVDTPFTYAVAKVDGTAVSSQDVADVTLTVVLDAGDYVVTVTKNGVSASVPFTVASDDVTLQVPDTVTVSFA